MGKEAKEKNTPNKLLISIVCLFFMISNAAFLITVIINFSILSDTLVYGSFSFIVGIFKKYYLYGCLAASLIQIILLMVLYYQWGVRSFPSTLSLISCAYNFVICIGFSALIYILNLKEIYFTLQILYLIPVITIFMSSVFLFDDYMDLLRNKYVVLDKKTKGRKAKQKQKAKKGELKFASNPNKDKLVNPNDVIHVTQTVITSAAEKAVPFTKPND